MMQFRLFGIPVVVEGWFWLSGVLLGGGIDARRADDWIVVGVWCLVMFVSVLIHELGHAVVGRRYGADPAIKLHGFGGLTFLPRGHFTRRQSILVSAAGPLAGLLLGCVLLAVALAGSERSLPPLAWLAVRQGLYINFVWSLLNLLPIQPLDGGQILREALGPGRLALTALIGGVLAVVLGVWALLSRQIFMAMMLGLLAFHNFRRDPVEGGIMKG